ncbi:hypothetical protein C4568_04780 [Candidatus Parcubacteria bacterium]|nr:MAG: hypothetical protein C4568_04780 [Candidatus Parcubacteria bacterium]
MKKNSITHNGVEFISAKDAAHATGYGRDYISRLCRQERISGYLFGKSWYVDLESLKKFATNAKIAAEQRREELSRQARNPEPHQVPVSEKIAPIIDTVDSPVTSTHHAPVTRQFEQAFEQRETTNKRRIISHISPMSAVSRNASMPGLRDHKNRAVALALSLGLVFSILSAANPEAAVRALNDAKETGIAVAFTAPETIAAVPEKALALATTDFGAIAGEMSEPLIHASMEKTQFAAAGTTGFFEILLDTLGNAYAAIKSSFAFGDKPMLELLKEPDASPIVTIDYLPAISNKLSPLAQVPQQTQPQVNVASTVIIERTTHQEILCIGTKEDETCITKSELDELLASALIAVSPSVDDGDDLEKEEDSLVPPSASSTPPVTDPPSHHSDNSNPGTEEPSETEDPELSEEAPENDAEPEENQESESEPQPDPELEVPSPDPEPAPPSTP